jgi:hypothetical protein
MPLTAIAFVRDDIRACGPRLISRRVARPVVNHEHA